MCRSSVGSCPEQGGGGYDGWVVFSQAWVATGAERRGYQVWPWVIQSVFGRDPVWGSRLVRVTE